MGLLEVFPLITLGGSDYLNLLPLFILSFGAILSIIVGTHKVKGHGLAFGVSLIVNLVSMMVYSNLLLSPEIKILGETLIFNSFSRTLSLMLLAFSAVALLITFGQDRKEGLLAEIYGLILFSVSGMILMVSTQHLLFMFIALEIMSLAIYVLVSMRRTSRYSAEAGLKYFILGGLASALFLYGSSLIFGACGSFDLGVIAEFLSRNSAPSFIYYIGLGLILTAMFFKIGAFPFHGWVPDVYQGASTNITGFMGASVKFTAFMALMKMTQYLVLSPNLVGMSWFENYVWLISAASMIFGNFVAISQVELKRMLSFSTIAHSGYLLVGLISMSNTQTSSEDLIIYLFFYALSNLGAFAVISQFEEKNQKDLTLEQISGLGVKHPVLGSLLTIFLLSMAGIPLTSGFIGKYGLFSSAVTAGQAPLVVIAVLTSVVSVYYYLRVIIYLFMKDPSGELAVYQKLRGAGVAAFISAAMTLHFGLFPRAIISFIKMISK